MKSFKKFIAEHRFANRTNMAREKREHTKTSNISRVNDFSCAMLFLDFPEMKTIHKKILVEDVYTDPEDLSFGLETDPHVTLLYGLHDEVGTNDVKKVVDNYTFGKVKAHTASLFENEKYDVLKFDIEGEGLKEVNADLSKFPNTNKFPDYHPHMTIAYLKPGTGKKYVDKIKHNTYNLMPTYVIYSVPSGEKFKIKIKI